MDNVVMENVTTIKPQGGDSTDISSQFAFVPKGLAMTKSICLSVAMSAAALCATARAEDGGVLPSEYQRVSYVEATGNQWVQTDYVPTGDAEYDFVATFNLLGTHGVFCSRSNDSTAGRAVFLCEGGLRWDYGVTDYYCADRDNSVADGTVCLVSIRKNEVYVNGVKSKISKPQPASFVKNNALVLFAMYSTDLGVKPTAVTYKGRMKLHSFTVREAGAVKLDLVPCFRKSDGCVGLYDRVSKVFLTPNGALVKGPRVDSDAGLDEAVVVVSSDCTSSDPEVKLRMMNSLRTVAPGVPVAVTADAAMDFLAGCARSPIAWTLASISAGDAPAICRNDGAHNRICSFTSQAGARYLLKWHYVTTTMAPSTYWLASGYERLKSVTTDGSQHLVTDYTPKGNTSIEVKMSRTSANATQAIYCSRGTDSTVNTFTLFLIDGGRLRWDYGATDSVDTTQTLAAPAAEKLFLFSNVRNKAYVDGAETILSKSAYSEYTAGNRLVLFASYGKPADEEPADFSNGASIRLYAFRVSEDGQPKLDLVPCRRTADGAIGLYDTVKGEFHVPAGNALQYESFGKSEVTGDILPPEYAKIGGVEATGSQYVLTDYRPNGNSCLKMKMTLKESGTQAIFCSRGSTDPLHPYSLFLYNGGLRWDYETVDITKTSRCETGKPMTITSNRHELYVDGTKSGISKSEAVDYEAGNRLVLFAVYGTDLPAAPTGFSTFAKVVLHEFEITEGGALKLRLVPCYRTSDLVVGLYDTVAKKFHEPGGGALRGVLGVSGTGLEVVGTGLGALGEPTLPYGVTEGVVAGDSFVCAAPEFVKTADGWAVCRGYLLETNDANCVWHPWKSGKETSFVYEHPAGSAVRLSWKWRKKSSGASVFIR